MNLKLQTTSKMLYAFLMTLFSVWGWSQGSFSVAPVFSEDFGSIIDGTNLTTTNTAFSYVRVGTSTGSASINNEVVAKNPSSFSSGSSALIGAKGGSITTVDKTGLTSFRSGAFTFKFRTPASFGSGTIVGAVGTGSSFGTNNGFTGAQLAAAFQVTGSSLQIRSNGAWSTVQTLATSSDYTVTIVFNNSTAALTYGDGNSLPVNRADIWINGIKSSTSFVSATNNLGVAAFRIYTNTTEYEVDDITVYNSVPDGSTTWNGSTWSGGTPNSSVNAIVTGNYTTSSTTPGFTAKNITIKNGGSLEIADTYTITGTEVVVEDGGNLIQRDGSTLASTNFKALRNSASVANKYVFWSSPVANQNLFTAYSNGSSSTAPLYVMSYDPATNLYPTVANDNANFTNNAGKGYSVKVPAANASLVFGGTSQVPNNGTINTALSNAGDGYNLIGNPYPSNINLTDFYTANNSTIESTLWFWDNTTGNVTTQTGNTSVNVGFATFNAQSGTWTEAPNTQSYGSAALNALGSFAKIGQGFIVKSINASPATFTNAMRSSAAAVTMNKNVNTAEGKYWIKLTTSYGNTFTQAITYNLGASDAYDAYDSKAMGTGSDAFYSLAGTEKLVIQGRAPFQINDVVPLGDKHFENGDFTISLAHKEGLFTNGQPIYLHDKQNGTYTNLQSGNYTFTANAGDFTNRFEIVYKLNVLSTGEAEKASFEVYRDGEDFVVRNHHTIQSVEVYDAAGRKIQQISSNSKSVVVKIQTSGVYILKAVSEGKSFTQKIIK
ncbi:T9SS type A sorting domain-containing protein [Chryseobacterium hagamense]|nr:T9SS type A sorting domain-containing protein [Chryseobacterium hagamense]